MEHIDVAVCHEWVTTYGGSEQVAARLTSALDADHVFTFVADQSLAQTLFPGRHIYEVAPSPLRRFGRKRWQWLLPFMAPAWKKLDLSSFDVVVTSSHSCVNAIRVGRDASHIAYCHTPMRYAWEWRSELGRVPLLLRPVWPVVAAAFRRADRHWAEHVDVFIANSDHVARRIKSAYGKNSVVIRPPIDTDFWTPGKGAKGNYFLAPGRLVAYKQVDVCITAARAAQVPLVVAGSGPEMGRLRKLATGADVTFVVEPDREALRSLYRGARALVFAGVEDFGMTMVEAQACGTPVIALKKGGALEAVRDGVTGRLYEDATSGGLAEEMRSFDPGAFLEGDLRAHAETFAAERFDIAIRELVSRLLASERSAP